MIKVNMEYNSSTFDFEIKIDDNPLRLYSKINKYQNKKLQEWISELPYLLFAEVNDDFNFIFCGSKADYFDLEEVINSFNKNNDIEITLSFKRKRVGNSDIELKIAVVAIMSSGKSTLINALLGCELMPVKNQACTATIANIRSTKNSEPPYSVCSRDTDGKIIEKREYNNIYDIAKISDRISEYNDNENVSSIDINYKLPFLKSNNVDILLLDTPGPNNSRDNRHAELTYSAIKSYDDTLIIYVLNGTQLSTCDDSQLLKSIVEVMKEGGKQSQDKFIFVANKIDSFDTEEDDLNEAKKNIINYLAEHGIKNPNIFLVSAESAKVLRMAQNGYDITDDQDMACYKAKRLSSKWAFEKYASLTPSGKRDLEQMLQEAEGDDVKEALIHTGVPCLEIAINEYIETHTHYVNKFGKTFDTDSILHGLYKNTNNTSNFKTIPQYNIAIVATMSAGKSSFVNALLGRDYIPSKNEACTAKIASIIDNDFIDDKIIGGYMDNMGNYFFLDEPLSSDIENWNRNSDISNIYIETDIRDITFEKEILIVHDTPGPNNSQDKTHEDISINFLKNNKINLYIYLLNAEHLTTDDNEKYMKDIYSIYNHNCEIIFLINKIDSFDLEKNESITNSITELNKYLREIGFKKFHIFPISSYAARLFKNVLNGYSLTDNEEFDFYALFKKFNNPKYDLMKYSPKHVIINNRKVDLYNCLEYYEQLEEKQYEVMGKKYSKTDIVEALNKTGINIITNYIHNIQKR